MNNTDAGKVIPLTLEGLKVNETLYQVVYWTSEHYQGQKKPIFCTLDKGEANEFGFKTKKETGLRIGIFGRTKLKGGGFSNEEREIT